MTITNYIQFSLNLNLKENWKNKNQFKLIKIDINFKSNIFYYIFDFRSMITHK